MWHLPTSTERLTGRRYVQMAADLLGKKPNMRVLGKTVLQIMGWFVPTMGEIPEMLYQYDRDYFFDSEKFNQRFNFTPTPYAEGIRAALQKG